MSTKVWRRLIVTLSLVFVFAVVPAVVYAETSDSNDAAATESASDNRDAGRGAKLRTELQQLKQQRLENKQQRLAENKLRVCEQRAVRIRAIMNRSITRAERQLALFTTIAERVKAFYADKGYSLDNYDELVAAVDAAKAEAQANLEILKDQSAFECDAADPKGNIEAFKLAVQSVNQDLKDYRTAVKDLIVGVKSAQSSAAGSEEGSEN